MASLEVFPTHAVDRPPCREAPDEAMEFVYLEDVAKDEGVNKMTVSVTERASRKRVEKFLKVLRKALVQQASSECSGRESACLQARRERLLPMTSSNRQPDERVKILLWHGYLLTGSGSNLYTANLARVWKEAGHDVLVMCQERHVESFPFIDATGDFADGNDTFELTPTGNPDGTGSCRLLRPHIGEVLPVYVFDEYEGFTAKTFVDLTDEELASYTDANVKAMVTALREFQPDAVVTGHEVMGPYIALEACRETGHEYLAKLHGSALEYAVKKQERYVRYAHDGLNGAKVVAGGSNYMVREALSVVVRLG